MRLEDLGDLAKGALDETVTSLGDLKRYERRDVVAEGGWIHFWTPPMDHATRREAVEPSLNGASCYPQPAGSLKYANPRFVGEEGKDCGIKFINWAINHAVTIQIA